MNIFCLNFPLSVSIMSPPPHTHTWRFSLSSEAPHESYKQHRHSITTNIHSATVCSVYVHKTVQCGLNQCVTYTVFHKMNVYFFTSIFLDSFWSYDIQVKLFSNNFLFHQDIQIFKKLHGVHCASHSGVNLRGVHPIAK